MLHLHFKSYLEMSWLICWLRKQWFLSLLSIEMKLHFETWTCTAMSLIHFRRISTTSEIRESTEGESRTCVWRSTLFSPMDNILRKYTSSGGPWKQQDWRNYLNFPFGCLPAFRGRNSVTLSKTAIAKILRSYGSTPKDLGVLGRPAISGRRSSSKFLRNMFYIPYNTCSV